MTNPNNGAVPGGTDIGQDEPAQDVTASVPAPEEYEQIAQETGVSAYPLRAYGDKLSVIKAGGHIIGLVNPSGLYFAPGRGVKVQPQHRG